MNSREACEWKLDEPDWNAYKTTCGGLFCVTDGTPKDNEMNFCPYCGGKLIIRPTEEE